jgi:hypothetical protein
MSAERWTEYRAIYTRPASILDKEYTGKGQAYVEERTGPYRSILEATERVTRNAAESHASVTGYERRQVQATEWGEV